MRDEIKHTRGFIKSLTIVCLLFAMIFQLPAQQTSDKGFFFVGPEIETSGKKFKDGKYLPEEHHRMNWINMDWEEGPEGLVYFAPESMIAEDGRRVMWTWLITEAKPSAIQALPREIWLPEDGILRMKPIRELESLRYDEKVFKDVTVTKGSDLKLGAITGDALEIEFVISSPLPSEFEIILLADDEGKEGIEVTYGSGRKEVTIGNIQPPFELWEKEDLTLRIFIDKNVVEVFMNDRQAGAVALEHIRENPNISLSTQDTELNIKSIKAWKMKSIYE